MLTDSFIRYPVTATLSVAVKLVMDIVSDEPDEGTLKLEIVGAPLSTQVTDTFEIFEPEIVPEPFETVQVSPLGWVRTVTEYAELSAKAVLKLKAPFAEIDVSFTRLFWRTTVPVSPEIVPETVYVGPAVGVTEFEAELAELVPSAFVAFTINVYD